MRDLSLILISIIFFACNPKEENKGEIAENIIHNKTETVISPKKDTSVNHVLLFKYFPKSIEQYKTIGYPDENDNPTGLPTGETASQYTYPKFISFAKHLYENHGKTIAVEILDYNIEKSAINGVGKMFSMDSAYKNEIENNDLYELKILKTKASYKEFKNENKTEMHIIVCERFLININILGAVNGVNLLKKVANEIAIKKLIEDYCD
jgi:hypothetical protein